MSVREKNRIIRQLHLLDENECLYHLEIPEEYREDLDVIRVERKLGFRTIGKRGYDVIEGEFFAYETIERYDREQPLKPYKECMTFEDFDSYFHFLDGAIYDDACYYQLPLSKIDRSVDYDRLFARKSLIDETIDEFQLLPTQAEEDLFQKGEKEKKEIKKWINKFVQCTDAVQLKKVMTTYEKSIFYKEKCVNVVFFLWQYVFFDIESKSRFQTIMDLLSHIGWLDEELLYPLCYVFNPDDVLEAYDYKDVAPSTRLRRKKKLRKVVERTKTTPKEEHSIVAFFDEKTHYYCVNDTYGKVYRYFESFNDFLAFRGNDLTHTDLSKDLTKRDYNNCKIDETTILPPEYYSDLKYEVIKRYTERGRFVVIQRWINRYEKVVKDFKHTFRFFFDFVTFLKGDLSGADLVFCEGLDNIISVDGLILDGAKLRSEICEKFSISFQRYVLDNSNIVSFPSVKNNEKQTLPAFNDEVERQCEVLNWTEIHKMHGYCGGRVEYLFDIHLLHKLKAMKVKSWEDVVYEVSRIAEKIAEESYDVLLIGGDVSSNFSVFTLFVKALGKSLKVHWRHTTVIFVLGNHELWDFKGVTLPEIVKKYRTLLNQYGMYLLQNEILFIDSNSKVNRIDSEEILSLSDMQMRERTRNSRVVFFGGIGFSGCNNHFNANIGLYRDVISREEEIKESKQIVELYNRVSEVLKDKNVVVFTHMPPECWKNHWEYNNSFVFVNGHTHRNYFYDDGKVRVYADNQIGYNNRPIQIKWFYLDGQYDYFADFPDGIHQISGAEYQEFYTGKNYALDFSRNVHRLFMLKKDGYYCFIHQNKQKKLSILNGGALKALEKRDIQYYYDHMSEVIATIKTPLDSYTTFQRRIADAVKRIGGSGDIHGCIIDIDFYNHIYVNPVDSKITGYWALDIMFKVVYPSIPELLKKKCPEIYNNYVKLLKDNESMLPALIENSSTELSRMPQAYFDTDMYKASREIRKMQKLHSNILTTWHEVT